MKLLPILSCLILSACAPLNNDFVFDFVGGPQGLSRADAERIYMDKVNSTEFLAAGSKFDKPPQLISAPQPTRAGADREFNGTVVVRIFR